MSRTISMWVACLLALCVFLALSRSSSANDLPTNFEESTILTGLDSPDHLLFAPDGRMFISERTTGKLLIAKYNVSNDRWELNPQPFYTFDTPKPEPLRSGGLRSIAFDPDFATNGYIYAFYMKNALLQNRVVRLKARTGNPDLADLTFGNSGEEVLIELPFNNTFASGSHNGGALVFGVDGKLYITTGDGWTGEFEGDPVQSLSTFTGKVLRINPDGTIPTDNPFYAQTTGRYRAIYALGLRNPYSVARHPESGTLYINEARGTNKASIYIVEAGANYRHEGTGIGTARTPWANATTGVGGQLVTGGAWYPAGGPFPSAYHGAYFTALWGGNEESIGQINFIQSETNTTGSLFQSNIGGIDDTNHLPIKPVILQIGPDGHLYYLLTTYLTTNGTVQRIRYATIPTAERPQISPNGGTYSSPQNISLTSSTAGATIYYTLDGSEPTTSSLLYVNSIAIGTTTVIKAKAFADGMNPSSTSSAAFTIGTIGTNLAPIVNAGADRTITIGETVALDGSGSTDPDGDDALLYDELWTQLSGPLVEIVDDTEEVAYFTPLIPGIYRFKLSLKDQAGATGSDQVEFTVVGQCDPLPETVIRNGNFEAGQTDWKYHSDNGGKFLATQAAYECQQAAEVRVTQAGNNIQFYQINVALEPSTQYRLSFAAYSSRGNDIALYLHKHTANYSSYGLDIDQIDLTTEWQLFTFDFTTTGFNTPVSDGRLRFWLSSFAQAGDTYWFDRIVLSKVSTNPATATATPAISPTPTTMTAPTITATATPTAVGSPTTTPTPPDSNCASSTENVIRNPDFVDGQSDWKFHSNARGDFTTEAPGYHCNQAARLQIQQASNNIQFYQTNVPLEPNTHYRLSFAAYSTSGNDLALYLHKHTANYSSYGLSVDRIDLTTEWQLYTIDFTTSGFNKPVSDGRLRFWLPSYAQTGDSYWIDHITLMKIQPTTTTATPIATLTATPTATPTVISGATATLTPTPTETAIPGTTCIVPAGNIIRNPAFTDGTADWKFYTNGTGRFQVATGDGGCTEGGRIEIVAEGNNVQLYQQNIALQPNTTYRFSFDAYAQNGSDLAIYLHKHTANYTNYGLTVDRIDLSTSWQHYTIDFVSTGFNAPIRDGRLRFGLSDYDSAGETYWFDNVSISTLDGSAVAADAQQNVIYLPIIAR